MCTFLSRSTAMIEPVTKQGMKHELWKWDPRPQGHDRRRHSQELSLTKEPPSHLHANAETFEGITAMPNRNPLIREFLATLRDAFRVAAMVPEATATIDKIYAALQLPGVDGASPPNR